MKGNEKIHSTAVIEEGVSLGQGCEIGPFAYLQSGSVLGDYCHVDSHAVIKGYARLGREVCVGNFCVIGGDPQYLGFNKSVYSEVYIGDSTRLGEGVTIHRSIDPGGVTQVGKNSFLMGYSHVAHVCLLGEGVVMANGSLLGGHVELGKEVFVGGGAAVHQFVRIGWGAMIGGLAEVSLDVGPHLLVTGRNTVPGLNLVGLRRRKLPSDELVKLKRAYRAIMKKGNLSSHAEGFLAENKSILCPLVEDFACFFTGGSRGFARPLSGRAKNI